MQNISVRENIGRDLGVSRKAGQNDDKRNLGAMGN